MTCINHKAATGGRGAFEIARIAVDVEPRACIACYGVLCLMAGLYLNRITELEGTFTMDAKERLQHAMTKLIETVFEKRAEEYNQAAAIFRDENRIWIEKMRAKVTTLAEPSRSKILAELEHLRDALE